jgi:DNA-binding NtrC family response regulator
MTVSGALLQNHWLVLIEDDPLLCSILAGFIEELGGRVSSFATADDALIHLLTAQQSPSLIVTDHLVPGQLKGAELASMVAVRWPEIALIVTTGYGVDVAAELPGNVLYLQKPWDLQQMKQAIIQMLQDQGLLKPMNPATSTL